MEYRKVAAALIVNKDKKILMCEHAWIDNAWQLPKGGIKEGETPEEALLRELKEELGTGKFILLKKSKKTVKYQLPYYLVKKYSIKGQEQQFFLVYFYGDDSEFKFNNYGKDYKPEFKNYQWVDYEEPPLRVIYFMKYSYIKALDEFREDFKKLDPKKIEEQYKEIITSK